ncbi:helix-hairpin-helix domain-containing protein [Polaribacter sargassicola]|uniref:helix-hairpin-helix domain-containing protein n=1 Tax=Polaribacter sargassicola TaxID=2836891 RepID=UPI001F289AF4|nr:helix-hairpin-helix domain-containing protein [Polaribacter sp. DS7-9]MCG1035550.1 helix-hairpin-helix domain-containing protein [Polaribacter sp. DS7-9]
MKILKSHFWYNKSQRNGIFLLVSIIILFQGFIFFDVFNGEIIEETSDTEVLFLQKQIDSLRGVEIYNRKPKIYPFNPNYITDYKGEQLGMSLDEIDRLLSFRKTNKFVNSKEEFQKITKVSDSLLNQISPYFKFPDWVLEKNSKNKNVSNKFTSKDKINKNKIVLSTTDINEATIEDLMTINGIGLVFSKRIIKYRSKLQGFSFKEQLLEVWGLDKEVADKLWEVFSITKKPNIKKMNVNTMEFKELLKNPYVDYELCKKIFNYRDEVAELQNISELKNIKDFPLDLYDRITLYLQAK